MINTLFILLVCLSAIIFIIEYKDNKYYKDAIEVEKMISFFSKTRMNVIRMVHLGEIEADSCYFKYILSATSYSIRALENIAILKEMSPYLLDAKLVSELKNLNYEQKRIFFDTIKIVLKIYLDAHYFENFLFKLCYQQATAYLKDTIFMKLRRFIPESTQKGVDYTRQLTDISNLCYA